MQCILSVKSWLVDILHFVMAKENIWGEIALAAITLLKHKIRRSIASSRIRLCKSNDVLAAKNTKKFTTNLYDELIKLQNVLMENGSCWCQIGLKDAQTWL